MSEWLCYQWYINVLVDTPLWHWKGWICHQIVFYFNAIHFTLLLCNFVEQSTFKKDKLKPVNLFHTVCAFNSVLFVKLCQSKARFVRWILSGRWHSLCGSSEAAAHHCTSNISVRERQLNLIHADTPQKNCIKLQLQWWDQKCSNPVR